MYFNLFQAAGFLPRPRYSAKQRKTESGPSQITCGLIYLHLFIIQLMRR
jgi:hypothetical protein